MNLLESPPRSFVELEMLSAELFGVMMGAYLPSRYGRGGQKQGGLDIVFLSRDKEVVGIQCKHHGKQMTDKDLARKFHEAVAKFNDEKHIEVDCFIYATSARTRAFRHHIELAKSNVDYGIEVYFWDNFVERLSHPDYDRVARWYKGLLNDTSYLKDSYVKPRVLIAHQNPEAESVRGFISGLKTESYVEVEEVDELNADPDLRKRLYGWLSKASAVVLVLDRQTYENLVGPVAEFVQSFWRLRGIACPILIAPLHVEHDGESSGWPEIVEGWLTIFDEELDPLRQLKNALEEVARKKASRLLFNRKEQAVKLISAKLSSCSALAGLVIDYDYSLLSAWESEEDRFARFLLDSEIDRAAKIVQSLRTTGWAHEADLVLERLVPQWIPEEVSWPIAERALHRDFKERCILVDVLSPSISLLYWLLWRAGRPNVDRTNIHYIGRCESEDPVAEMKRRVRECLKKGGDFSFSRARDEEIDRASFVIFDDSWLVNEVFAEEFTASFPGAMLVGVRNRYVSSDGLALCQVKECMIENVANYYQWDGGELRQFEDSIEGGDYE